MRCSVARPAYAIWLMASALLSIIDSSDGAVSRIAFVVLVTAPLHTDVARRGTSFERSARCG